MKAISWNRLPVVSLAALLRLWYVRECGVILAVLATHFVDHEIQRWHDVEAKTACAGFPKSVLRGSGHMAIGIVLPLEAEGRVFIVGAPALAFLDVIRRHQLLAFPPAFLCEAITKAHRIRGMKGCAASAIGMRHDEVASMQAVIPGTPTLRLGEALMNVVLQLHAADISQHDAGDVRGRR